jgi:chromosome segregation ATPase
VLYLAEVLRKNRSVLGSGKAEFKLLASQKTEQQWVAVPNEELVSAPDDVTYAAGALVMVELTASKQIQRHNEAGRQLVSILQNFSRLHDKAKTQEEEIEQWKQSLTYQSQELNRREMEMEAQQEELQQREEELATLEQKGQEIAAAQQEIDRLREEYDRKSQELEGAWAQLQGETNRLEERQSELQQSPGLDEDQARYLQDLLNRLSGAVTPVESIQEQLNFTFEVIAQQQTDLDGRWQNLEQHKAAAQERQAEVDQQSQSVQEAWQVWHESQAATEAVRLELRSKQEALASKQECAQALATKLAQYETLHQQVTQLMGVPEQGNEALENMPIEELKNLVKDLEKDLEKMSKFVHSQEEELALQQQTIDELTAQSQEASEYDRLRLESELSEEQDCYQMLNQTLVGQRRNLVERQGILKQHQTVLAKRQGVPMDDAQDMPIDLTPLLVQVEEFKTLQAQEKQELEAQIQQLQESIDQVQSTVTEKVTSLDAKRHEIMAMEQQLRTQMTAAAELWGKVNTSHELLQPMQEGIHEMRQKAEAIASVMTQFQEAGNYQLQAIGEMQVTLERLTGRVPELVA